MQNNPGTEKLKTEAKQSFDRAVKLLGQNTFAKQLASGTATGWITGAVVGHTGKTVAAVVGSGIIIYQIAHHKGYISPDWTNLKNMAEKTTSEMSNKYGKGVPTIQTVKSLAAKNKTFTAGFLGGFLLGIAL